MNFFLEQKNTKNPKPSPGEKRTICSRRTHNVRLMSQDFVSLCGLLEWLVILGATKTSKQLPLLDLQRSRETVNATEQLHIAANVNVLMMSFNYLRFIMFVVIVISVVVMVMAIIIIINNAFGYRVVQGPLFFILSQVQLGSGLSC